MSKLLVIIPSYNESDNIARLITRLLEYPNLDVLVVDDNSPDGTAAIIKKEFTSNPRVTLIVRQKKDGRGGAVLDGIQWALDKGDYDKIVEMDADFSHDPEELPALIKASEKADVVIGSRYLPQSRIIGWPIKRKVFSRCANLLAKNLLHIPISDYTNGYRLYSAKAAKAIDRSVIGPKGYIVLSAIAYQLHVKGFRFADVPTIFVNRKRGESNTSPQEIWDAFSGIFKIKNSVR